MVLTVLGVKSLIQKTDKDQKVQSVYLIISTIVLVAFFSSADILGELTGFYEITLIGAIGMLVFISVLSYLIVEYKAFNVKLISAQALIVVLLVLIGSLLLVVKSPTSQIISSITLVFTAVSGYLLVKSVKREVEQREKIEKLAKDLEKANTRLKELDKQKSEFVSIASHQLRSPLTAIRGYASMLAEGSFGKLPEKAMESARRIEESAKLMAISIEDYLNVSRIESGNMKYSLSDFNLRDMVDHICDDLRPEAVKHNLILLFRSNINSRGIVHADVGKTSQIIHNLINNSLKYTPQGSISVLVRDDIKKKRIYVEITDTGIGMSEKTLHTIFQKFERANNANSVNVSGTGLGLYVALKMAEAMGGTISAASEGDGKGSTFTFELPLAM
ncbi:MAG TPA: HAMP domain-containing sensor histidine kinase [Candidatus Paceibacterota bacterium]